jgi:hypothetical protein
MADNSLFWILCVVFSLAYPAAPRAELIDHVVAAVNNDVITGSELNQAVAFNAVMGGRQDDRRLRAETLEGLINRRLLLQEASRLRFVEVSSEETDAEVEAIRKRLGTEQYEAFLGRLNMSGEDLGRMLGERLLVERFIEKKISLFARVSREEAESYYRDHAERYKGKRFPEVREEIAALLFRQKVDQQLELYVAELRGKADIRINP